MNRSKENITSREKEIKDTVKKAKNTDKAVRKLAKRFHLSTSTIYKDLAK